MRKCSHMCPNLPRCLGDFLRSPYPLVLPLILTSRICEWQGGAAVALYKNAAMQGRRCRFLNNSAEVKVKCQPKCFVCVCREWHFFIVVRFLECSVAARWSCRARPEWTAWNASSQTTLHWCSLDPPFSALLMCKSLGWQFGGAVFADDSEAQCGHCVFESNKAMLRVRSHCQSASHATSWFG